MPESDTLRALDLFAGYRDEDLQRIASLLHGVHVRAETVVLNEREAGDRFVVIAAGEARVTQQSNQGVQELAVLGPGAFVGEMSLLERQPRTATVTAVTPLTVYVCDPREFAALLAAAPALEEEISRTAAERLKANRERAAGSLRVRMARPEDRAAVEGMLDRLSPESWYLRFFTPSTAAHRVEAESVEQLDGVDRVAVLAEVDGEVVGLARFARSEDQADAADVSIEVEDRWQGQGIGLALLNALGEAARAQGVRTFLLNILPENQRSIGLFRRFSPETRLHYDGGVLDGESGVPG